MNEFEKWGKNPTNKVVGGRHNDPRIGDMYVCQANYDGGLHPGKTYNGYNGCSIGWGGREVSNSDFNYFDSNKQFIWTKNPTQKVKGGEEFGNNLYICRANMIDGVHPGKTWEGATTCKIGWNGQEKDMTDFEYLSYAPICSDISSCLPFINLSNWSINKQNQDGVTLSRSCTNKVENKDACSLLPKTENVKYLPWAVTNQCSKVCNGGLLNKTVNFNNQKFTSNNIPCNTVSCDSIANRLPVISMKNIYPPSAVPQGSQTATINNITYTFTNDGGNGLNAAWTFDKNNDTWTFFDGKGRYNTTTGVYEGTALTNNIRGAWQQMQLSTPVLINGYYINTNSPFSEWYLFGSNNGSTWTQLDNRNINLPINQDTYFVFNNTKPYTHYRLVITKSIKLNDNSYAYAPSLSELTLFNADFI